MFGPPAARARLGLKSGAAHDRLSQTMRAVIPMRVDESIEHRYLAIVRLGASLARAGDWAQVAAAVAESVAPVSEQRPARLWGRTADGYEVLGHSGHEFPRVS